MKEDDIDDRYGYLSQIIVFTLLYTDIRGKSRKVSLWIGLSLFQQTTQPD